MTSPLHAHTCKSIFSHLSWNLSWASRVKDGEGIFPSPLLAANAANLQGEENDKLCYDICCDQG